MSTRYIKYAVLGIIILVIISLLLSVWLPFKQSLRIVFGSVYLLFLPGFVWSWVFWKKHEIDGIERLIISLVLSLAIVPLIVFLLNKTGVKINTTSAVIEIGGILVAGHLIFLIQQSGWIFKFIKRLRRNR